MLVAEPFDKVSQNTNFLHIAGYSSNITPVASDYFYASSSPSSSLPVPAQLLGHFHSSLTSYSTMSARWHVIVPLTSTSNSSWRARCPITCPNNALVTPVWFLPCTYAQISKFPTLRISLRGNESPFTECDLSISGFASLTQKGVDSLLLHCLLLECPAQIRPGPFSMDKLV